METSMMVFKDYFYFSSRGPKYLNSEVSCFMFLASCASLTALACSPEANLPSATLVE